MAILDELRANGGMTNGLSDDFNKWPVAHSFAQLARELAATKEKVAEKEEEVGELKSERSNTRVRYMGKRVTLRQDRTTILV